MGFLYIASMYVLPLSLIAMAVTEGVWQYVICQIALLASAVITYIKTIWFLGFLRQDVPFSLRLGASPVSRIYAVVGPCTFVFCIIYNIIHDGAGFGNLGLVALLLVAIFLRYNKQTL